MEQSYRLGGGAFPTLIAIISMFFVGVSGGAFDSMLSALLLTLFIVLGVCMTFAVSKVLSMTVLKGIPSSFTLELTEVKGRTEPYDLGECEFHLAFTTDDFDGMYQRHRDMGCICFENRDMGVYFIEDPDGYWIEIVPQRS